MFPILVRNIDASVVDLRLVSGFTIGLRTLGDGRGVEDSTLHLLRILNNRYGLDIRAETATAWNTSIRYYGGHFACATGINPTIDRYGIRFSRGAGGSGTTMQWNAPAKGWNAGAVMADASLNRRQTIRVGPGASFAQVGIVGFDGQIELEALRLFGLPEAAPAVLYACPAVPVGTRSLALETSWDLPSLGPGATANIDVTVPGARRGDVADASLDTSSIAFVLDCHVWSNNSVRVTARNVSASTVDLAAAPLAMQVTKRRIS